MKNNWQPYGCNDLKNGSSGFVCKKSKFVTSIENSKNPNQTIHIFYDTFSVSETDYMYKYYPWSPGSFQLVVDGKIFILMMILNSDGSISQ